MKLPLTMNAMVTHRHGDADAMTFHTDWPLPSLGAGEVLIKVAACGLNNTDINTRIGWYSKTVTTATTGDPLDTNDEEAPAWSASPIQFPRIQGADICGTIVAVGKDVDTARIGERVISDTWLRDPDTPDDITKTGYVGSERDGGFAQFAALPSANACRIRSDLTDAELATFSCSYSTAEGMLTRAAVTETDTVLIPGASGGVGSALVQLAKLRGARVIAMASAQKHDQVRALGADMVLPRAPEDLKAALADETITVLADVVGGAAWPTLLDVLARGGRYTCSGAIAGPMVELDLRTLYLRDLTFVGSTVLPPQIMKTLIGYIEAGKIQPALAATFPLKDLHKAQDMFMAKQHTGNIVVTP